MDKLTLITEYINKCDDIIEAGDQISAGEFSNEIIAVFQSEILQITSQLSAYTYWGTEDNIKDIITLKSILVNYLANIRRDDKIRKDELDKLRLEKSILNITNTNTNNVSSIANASSVITITVSQALENINNISEDILSQEDKEILEDKIASLDLLSKSGDKERTSKKLGSIVKYVADKGIEVGIAILPYLGEISKIM